MASDRGTIPRGAGPGIDQHQPWADPTSPAGRRMPSAPRERKPALAALAVILIVGGAAAAGLLVVKSGQRVSAIEITQQIGQGQQIPQSAMQEVQISANSGVKYVSWSFANQVTQYFAANPISPGTLLNAGMVSKTNTSANGKAELGLALKDGEWPANLQIGDTVNIYSTQTSASGCPGHPGQTLAVGATVIAVSGNGSAGAGISATSSGNGTTDVEVAVDPAEAGAVACNTANGTASIVVVPNNATG
ncbi:MAG: hypothetical protein JOY82_16015 [Streptosporangiaceae bacterium]|nr:hypothetical protein [Streptosporangiaceae bacterium]MBV9855998.1 hypothetical protein [Streptosporangiaceae bacterium]